MPRYLVSSASKTRGGLFIVDSVSGDAVRVMERSLRGLAPGPDGGFYAVTGHRGADEQNSSIYRFDPETRNTDVVSRLALGDCHDIRWFDGHFYVVASLGNVIVRLDDQCREIDRLQVIPDERDVCHVNCLGVIDGELHCSVFTLAPGERKEKRRSGAWFHDGKVLKLDWDRKTFTEVFGSLAQPHSLVCHEDALFVAESHTSTLTRIDLASGRRQALGQFQGFVRGIVFAGDEMLLGTCKLSAQARQNKRALPFLRRTYDRLFPFAGIFVLDPKRWRVRRKIAMPDTEPYDIYPLPPRSG